jgi:hypothetical protein
MVPLCREKNSKIDVIILFISFKCNLDLLQRLKGRFLDFFRVILINHSLKLFDFF